MRREGKAVEITKVEFHREADPPYATVHGFLRVNYMTAVSFNLILDTGDTAALDRLLESACERIRHDVGEAMQDRVSPADARATPKAKKAKKGGKK
jgi:hypothetical protein